MTTAHDHTPAEGFPILQAIRPITPAQVPAEIVAGITLAALLAGGLAGIASTGSDKYVALAAVLALLAAGFLIVARLIRLGFMADFLSRTVLIGFLTGVGIQVALGQISGMLGLAAGGHNALEKLWIDLQQL